jgi:transcriptional regulator with XRE-family HTH domain/tetratricopeptide (TPR) repeat protein
MMREARAPAGRFASTLRDYRAAANLTQEELAARSGLSVHAIGMLERGVRRTPRPGTVELLAQALRLGESERAVLVAAAHAETGQNGGPSPSIVDPGVGMPNPALYFVGREAEMRQLAEMLERSGRAAVSGLGGVGKTQLAARYVHQNRDGYPDGVFWLRAEQEGSLAGDLASLTWRLELPERAAPEHERRIEATVRWLGEHPRWLVVLDNLEPGAIETRDRWLPPSLPGHVLTTSRTPLPPPHLHLESFPAATARRYLLERTAQADEAAAGAIAEALGRLPLALAQAAAYLDQTGRDLSSYAALLRDRLVELMTEGRPDDYPRSVVSTLSLSVQRLADEHPAAVALLRLCAFLAGEEIPIQVLRAGAGGLPEPLRNALRDEIAIDRTVAALRRYSLAEREGDGLRVHRLVQAIVRGSLPTAEYRAWLGAAVRLLAPYFPDDIDEQPELWPMCVRLLPHAQLLDELTADDPVEPAALVALLHGAGAYLWSQGEYGLAEPAMVRAAAIAEHVLGAGHPFTVICAQGLGILRWYQGDLTQARQLLQRQAAVLEQHPEDAETLLATVLHNLAGVMHAQYQLADARPIYERALELRWQALGPEHPHTAYTLNNLGTLLRDQGDFGAALPMLEHALSIRERVLGPEHPETAQSLGGVGLLRFRQGDLDAAESALTRAIAIRHRVLGAGHDRTARTRHHLALVRWEQGDPQAARRLIRRAATDLRRRLGAEHPWTVEARTALANMTEAGGPDTQQRLRPRGPATTAAPSEPRTPGPRPSPAAPPGQPVQAT